MPHRMRWRYLGPVALICLCLVVLCAFTAASLWQQQSALSGTLRENIASFQAAAEFEECLFDLITLLQHRVEAVSSLDDRIRRHLDHLHRAADHAEEKELADQLDDAFADYQKKWLAMPGRAQPGHEQAVRGVAQFLEAEMLRPCQKFELHNKNRIDDSTEGHERVLSRLAWGLAGVGGLGAVAGLVLGFGVARSVSRSIHRLRVQVHAAEGKIERRPDIVWSEDGDFGTLHDEVDRLSGHIEAVVRQLRERELEVLRAEQLAAVGQLAAGVAHEIRNPLTSIKLLVQTGLEDATEALSPEDLQVMEREILRMEQSLRTFLDFARPTKPERRHLRVGPLVAEVVGLVRGRATKQGVAIETDVPDDVPGLSGDGPQLHQVLVNLTLNALDAMPTGGRLTIRARRLLADRVAIEVADTGPGIPAELLPRLFRPFVSGKDTGLGLGLVISRRIAEAHGGSLTAANRPDGGASFVLMLPTEAEPCPTR